MPCAVHGCVEGGVSAGASRRVTGVGGQQPARHQLPLYCHGGCHAITVFALAWFSEGEPDVAS
jgi:hypothetical protein